MAAAAASEAGQASTGSWDHSCQQFPLTFTPACCTHTCCLCGCFCVYADVPPSEGGGQRVPCQQRQVCSSISTAAPVLCKAGRLLAIHKLTVEASATLSVKCSSPAWQGYGLLSHCVPRGQSLTKVCCMRLSCVSSCALQDFKPAQGRGHHPHPLSGNSHNPGSQQVTR